MERLLNAARFTQAKLVIFLKRGLWHDDVIPNHASIVMEFSVDKDLLSPLPYGSTRSTLEPEELEIGTYIGFGGTKPLKFGRHPTWSTVILPHEKGFSRYHFEIRLTRFGTWVVHRYDSRPVWVNNILVDVEGDVALDPSEGCQNEIKFVDFSIKCIVVYDDPISISTFDEPLSPEPSRDLARLNGRSRSSTRSTSSPSTNYELNVREDKITNYYVLDSVKLDWSTTAFLAIRARPCTRDDSISPGATYLVHRFHSERWFHLSMYYSRFRRLPRHPHLASIVGVDGDSGLLVQEHCGTLALQGLDPSTACVVFRQVLSGLSLRHKDGISHGDIRPEFIIKSHKSRTYAVQLDGFWSARIAKADKKSDSADIPFQPRKDLCDLATVVLDLIVEHDTWDGGKDPLFMSTLESAQEENCQAEEVMKYVENLTQNTDEKLFGHFAIYVSVKIGYLNGRSSPFFKADDLASLYELTMRGKPSFVTQSDVRLIAALRQDGFKYIGRKQLKMRMTKSQWLFMSHLLPSTLDPVSGHLRRRTHVFIPCIKSCAMINVSHLLAIKGLEWYDAGLDYAFEVYGTNPTYSGLYVHVDKMKDIVQHNKKISKILMNMADNVFKQRLASLFKFSPKDHVFFMTDLPWCSLVALRRSDLHIQWDMFSLQDATWLSLDDSYKRCDQCSLHVLKALIQDSVTSMKPRSSVSIHDYIGLQCDGKEQPAEPFLTGSDSEDQLKFKRKRGLDGKGSLNRQPSPPRSPKPLAEPGKKLRTLKTEYIPDFPEAESHTKENDDPDPLRSSIKPTRFKRGGRPI